MTSPRHKTYTLRMVGAFQKLWLYCHHMFIITTFRLGHNLILRQIVRGAGFSF